MHIAMACGVCASAFLHCLAEICEIQEEACDRQMPHRCKLIHMACAQHDLGQTAAKVSGMVRTMMEQPGLAELREDLRNFKRRTEAQINSVSSELAIVKNCIMQLYNVLLPGKFPMQHLQPPPVMPHIPATQQFPTPQQALPQPSQLKRASAAHHAPPQHPTYPHLSSVGACPLMFTHLICEHALRLAHSSSGS